MYFGEDNGFRVRASFGAQWGESNGELFRNSCLLQVWDTIEFVLKLNKN